MRYTSSLKKKIRKVNCHYVCNFELMALQDLNFLSLIEWFLSISRWKESNLNVSSKSRQMSVLFNDFSVVGEKNVGLSERGWPGYLGIIWHKTSLENLHNSFTANCGKTNKRVILPYVYEVEDEHDKLKWNLLNRRNTASSLMGKRRTRKLILTVTGRW